MIQRRKRNASDQKPTRYYSSEQEKSVAKNLGGKRQPNSGATMFAKGDVVADNWLIECKVKTTHSDSMSIKKSWIEKNATEALFLGKPFGAIAFSFGPGEENYYIIDEDTMVLLIKLLEKNSAN